MCGFFGTFLARAVMILAHRNRVRDPANTEQGDEQSPDEVDPAERGDQVEEETQAVDRAGASSRGRERLLPTMCPRTQSHGSEPQ